MRNKTSFFTLASSHSGLRHAFFLAKSLRKFGGSLRESPFLIFVTDPEMNLPLNHELDRVNILHIEVPQEVRDYWFGVKVQVCATAESMTEGKTQSLIWMNPQCLIVNPPVLFDLDSYHDAAFRPVHIQNVGLISGQRPDPFWSEVYRRTELAKTTRSLESYVDSKMLQPYFNTHLFSVNPGLALLRTWLDIFRCMITDQEFQSGPCKSDHHKIFLHQAILSALLVKKLEWGRIRILPPEYSYPLHFHHEIPPDRQADSVNDLVCPVYEGEYQFPETHNGLVVREPLLSWIMENKPVDKE